MPRVYWYPHNKLDAPIDHETPADGKATVDIRPASDVPPTLTREEARTRLLAMGQSEDMTDALLRNAHILVRDDVCAGSPTVDGILRAYVAHLDAQHRPNCDPASRVGTDADPEVGDTVRLPDGRLVVHGERASVDDALGALREMYVKLVDVDDAARRLRDGAAVVEREDGDTVTAAGDDLEAVEYRLNAVDKVTDENTRARILAPLETLGLAIEQAQTAEREAHPPMVVTADPSIEVREAHAVLNRHLAATQVREGDIERPMTLAERIEYLAAHPCPSTPLDTLKAIAALVKSLPHSGYPCVCLGTQGPDGHDAIEALAGAHINVQSSSSGAGKTLSGAHIEVDGIEFYACKTREATPEEAARWAAERGAT